jgi:hypothetical protein
MNALSKNFNVAGAAQGSPISVESVEFDAYGDYAAVMPGWMLAHATVTNTATGTGVLDPADAAVTKACAGSLHVWDSTATDTYVVKVEHSSDNVNWADLVTFTMNGTALGAEVVKVASGTVNKYRRALATRTGVAGDTFGYSVFFWHA